MSSNRGGGRGGGGGGHGKNRHDSQPRTVLVSKALSRLLRHAAVQERVPIDNQGYVRLDHLLAWQRLRSMKPPVTFDEVVEVVQENEKKRFALKYASDDDGQVPENATKEDSGTPTEAQTETETQRAIAAFEAAKQIDSPNLKLFFIRASQGHSMKLVEAENLLTRVSLDEPDSIPDTVVHGTFYGAWDRILQSGGLKPMTRNHVHFASGPALSEVWSSEQQTQEDGRTGSTEQNQVETDAAEGDHPSRKGNFGSILGKNKVISGMRSDAQILIYIDIRCALEQEPEMKWWRSENGVILTEGVLGSSSSATGNANDDDDDSGAGRQKAEERLVPSKYFAATVEIKEGLGLLYDHGQGVVKELPQHLKDRAVPRGKQGNHGKQSGPPRGGGNGNNGKKAEKKEQKAERRAQEKARLLET